MRFVLPIALAIVSGPVFAEDLPPTVNHDATQKAGVDEFVVHCRITENEEVLSAPLIRVKEGESASVSIAVSHPFATAVRGDSPETAEPILTTMEAGSKLQVVLTSLDEDSVQVDATVKQTVLTDVEEIEAPNLDDHTIQSPQTCSHEIRTIRAVRIGEALVVSCGCACEANCGGSEYRIRIERAYGDEPAITPITTSRADKIEEDSLYTVVYAVADLLEPYAIAKPDSELEHADFVPIIDEVLRGALVDWSDEASIVPVPRHRGLVVSQTRQGHEKISEFLRDKRDRVADVNKLLLR